MPTYKIDFVALAFMVFAAIVLAGAFGGSCFERGVAALLTMQASEIAAFEATTTRPSGLFKLGVQLMLWGGIGFYLLALGFVLAGLA